MNSIILDNPPALAGALYMVAERAIERELEKLGKKYGDDMSGYVYALSLDLYVLNDEFNEVEKAYRMTKTRDWNIPNATKRPDSKT